MRFLAPLSLAALLAAAPNLVAPASSQEAPQAAAPKATPPAAQKPGTEKPGAAEPGFHNPVVAKDADRYETFLKASWKPAAGGAPVRKAADLRQAGERLLATDARAAAREYAQAVVAEPRTGEGWLGLAKALLAVKPDADKGSERYDLPVNASAAAFRAYERGGSPAFKARALVVLGEALARRSLWRPALDAVKQSLALNEDAETRASYEKLRSEHGFRMVDYKTDADAQTPRLCLQFSERLSRTQSDFAKFVSIDGRDPQNVVAEDKQLCLEGLAHGQRYEIGLRAGLPSDVGEAIEKPATIAAYIPDRKPFVRFTGKSYVLPSRGQQGIPVVSVNTTRLALEVYRIGDRSLATALQGGELQRQLSTYDAERLKDQTGSLVYKGEMDVSTKLNDEVTTAFPVSDAIGTLKPGAYAMIARPSDRKSEHSDHATQWFVVSDLGLTALSGDDGVHAFVRSLASADPVAGAEVRLVAKNNEVLGTATSDARGYVRFPAGLGKGEGGQQPALLVAEMKGGGEYAFLDLTASAFDLSDRGVSGRAASGPLDGFLYAERGVYRPGESVYLTGLVRDRAGKAASLPTTLIVTRPDGVEHKRFTLSDMGLGGRSATLALGSGVMTGTWRAKLHADPKADPIAQVAFLVEDFVPERLDLKLEPAAGALKPEQAFNVTALGRYLYGPAAANLAVEADINVKPSAKDVAGFPGYKFGLADEKFTPVRKTLDGMPATDAEGRAVLPIQLPAITRTARALEADVIVRLREPGGRTLERVVNVPVDLGQPRLGIKPVFPQAGLQEDETANFEVIALDASGKASAAKGLRWELLRVETSWQWYSRDGNWQYEPITITRKAANGTLDVSADTPARIAAKVGWGRYRLEVASAEPDGPASSYAFNVGWYASSEASDSPENLDIALDKASYKVGETAKVRIASKQAGKALVAVLSNGILASHEVDVPKGGAEVPVTVGEGWGSGAYVTAMMYRAMDEKAKRMPSRAIGVKWLPMDTAERTLKVSLDTAEKIRSSERMAITAKVGGLKAGEEARVTVAAVDLGILNLTRYQIPAPGAHFYAQRQLGLEIRDYYGRLIDGMNAERGRLRSGGDGMGGSGMSMDGSPPVEATVALYSGIVKVDQEGSAKVDFPLPDFNGTVRVMAVAWSSDKVGHGSKDVIVRDRIAVTASAPRFLTLGDEARLDVSVHNIDSPAGDYNVVVERDETKPGAAGLTYVPVGRTSLPLKPNERKSDRVALKPADVGAAIYNVNVLGPDSIVVKRQLRFEVKPPAGDIKRTTVASIAGKGKLTLAPDLVHDMIAGRTRVNLTVGPAARLDVAGVLAALDRYPYGCAEQTVSRAMPLVYANAVAKELGLGVDQQIRERVQGAVDRVFEMQDASGAFGVWGPYAADMWLTAYVTDFLTRAKEAGYQVRQQSFAQALDKLQNFVAYAQDFKNGGEERAYALYVLARNGRSAAGELRYYVDTRLDRFATPLAKAQLGAALAMIGDKERAERAMKAALVAFDAPAKETVSRADFGSNLRDGAALVTLASETGVAKAETPRLVGLVAKAYRARSHTSTQEQAWMMLAANALADEAKSTLLSVNGQTITGSLTRAFTAEDLARAPITVSNESEQATDAVITVLGAALTPEPAAAKGLKVERSFFTLDGKPVDLKSASGGTATLKQNERLVAVVKVEAKEAGGRLLVVDRLPAGLEIENPRLVEGGDIKALDWLKGQLKPEHTEFRDDRFVAAFNFFGSGVTQAAASGDGANDGAEASEGEGEAAGENHGNEQTAQAEASTKPKLVSTASVAYIVRAVTPGTFVHPAATAEDMYRPERHARSAAGRLTITPKE